MTWRFLSTLLIVFVSAPAWSAEKFWKLAVQEPAKGNVEPITVDGERFLRFNIEALNQGKFGEVLIYRTIGLADAEVLKVKFKARAAWVRTIGMGRRNDHSPVEINRSIIVEPEWRTFEQDLPATPAYNPTQLVVDVSEDKGWVEIGPITVMSGDKSVTLPMNMTEEAVDKTKDQSLLDKDPPDAWTAMVETASEFPEDVQVRGPMSGLKEGMLATLSFVAKADKPRPITVGVSNDSESSEDLGLVETVDLTTEWKNFSLDFEVLKSADPAIVQFDLAHETGNVSVGGIKLTSVVAPPKPRLPTRRDWAFTSESVKASCEMVNSLPWHVRATVFKEGTKPADVIVRLFKAEGSDGLRLRAKSENAVKLPIVVVGEGGGGEHSAEIKPGDWNTVELPAAILEGIKGTAEVQFQLGVGVPVIEITEGVD